MVFRSIFKIPHDVYVGMELTFEDTGKAEITRIYKVEFLDSRTMSVKGKAKLLEQK